MADNPGFEPGNEVTHYLTIGLVGRVGIEPTDLNSNGSEKKCYLSM